MVEEPKPCPFCGGTASLHSNFSRSAKTFFVYVKCDICGGQGKIYNTGGDPSLEDWETEQCEYAVNAWNMRTK